VEGPCDLCKVPDEPPVEVAESDEFPNPPYFGGQFPLADCITFVLVHPEPVSREFYAQEIDPVFVELAFLGVEEDFGLPA